MKKLIIIALILYFCFAVNATAINTWYPTSTVVEGLGDVGSYAGPAPVKIGSTLYLIVGNSSGEFSGFEWNGTGWDVNYSIVSGLGDVGSASKPSVFYYNSVLYLISGNSGGTFSGFEWNGTGWDVNSSIVSGLGSVGIYSAPTVFIKSSILYLISGKHVATFSGFHWTGSTWTSNSTIISGLGDLTYHAVPTVFWKDDILYMIAGSEWDVWGFVWAGTAWETNSTIKSGLVSGGAGVQKNTFAIFNESGWKAIQGLISGGFKGHIENLPPNTPTGYTNLGTHVTDHTPTVEWTSDEGITTYVYVGTTSTPTTVEGSTTGETLDLGSTFPLSDGLTYYYRLRSYNVVFWSDYTTADQFRMNSVVTTTLSSPGDGTTQITDTTLLTVNSASDNEGDTLYYLIYGDNTSGTILLQNTTGLTYNWNHGDNYGPYYWKVRTFDGFEYSANSSVWDFAVIVAPLLTSPVNESTHNFDFPPMVHNITFLWEDMGASSYHLEVAKDVGFNQVALDIYPTTNTYIYEFGEDRYWWRVSVYDTTSGNFSDTNETWNFNVTLNSPAEGTAIQGVIYEVVNDVEVPLAGVLVSIRNSNLTWSNQVTTGINGYYLFDNLDVNTYYIHATKELYDASETHYITTTLDNTSISNILMILKLEDIWKHYVEFIVINENIIPIPNVDVEVFIGEGVIAYLSGKTGSNGAVGFELYEKVRYRFELTSTDPAFTKEFYLYPIDLKYTIKVHLYADTISEIEYELSAGTEYINLSWVDNADELTWIRLKVTNSTGTVYNQIDYDDVDTLSFPVLNTSDKYCYTVTLNTTTYDGEYSFKRCYYPLGRPIPIGGLSENSRNIMSMFMLCVLGMMFTSRSAPVGAVAVGGGGLLLSYINWLNVGGLILSIIFIIAIASVLKMRGHNG